MISLHAAASPGELRIAAFDGATLCDFAIERPGAPDGVGDVLAVRVTRLAPAMAGAFVALPGDEPGFMTLPRAASVAQGDIVTAEVTRAAHGGKGKRLAWQPPMPPGSAPPAGSGVRLLAAGPGPLLDLAALYPQAPLITDHAGLAARLRPLLGARVRLAQPCLDDSQLDALDALAAAEAALPGGLRARFAQTAALCAIDIDLAGAVDGAAEATRAHLAANRAAIPALARQIRLRALGGVIVIDFAGLASRARAALAPDLQAALQDDPARPRLLGFTAAGLAEIIRPRRRAPLAELLAGPHAAALAALRQMQRAQRARPAARLHLALGVAAHAALAADRVALAELRAALGYLPALRSDPRLPPAMAVVEEEGA